MEKVFGENMGKHYNERRSQGNDFSNFLSGRK
jgi:hypothetical protein